MSPWWHPDDDDDDDDDDESVYMRFVIGMSYQSWDTLADIPKCGAFYWVNAAENLLKPTKEKTPGTLSDFSFLSHQ